MTTPKTISGSELKEMIKVYIKEALVEHQATLKENLANDVLPGANGELVAYTIKVEKFLDATIEEAEKLHEEGSELLAANVLRDPLVGERDRLILMIMGFLKKMKNGLSTSSVDLRKMF